MLKKMICAIAICIAPLAAETIGDIDYQLPTSAKEWKVLNQMDNPKTKTIVYIPSDVSKGYHQQVFTVHNNNLPSDMKDDANVVEGLIKTLEMYYPDTKVKGNIIEKDNDSILFEWSVNEEEKEKLHGWYRMFGSPEGTVLLGYQTGDIKNLDGERNTWLPTLKGAKRVNK